MPGHLILIGFMASGKTTVGRLVADRIERPFVDVDETIEEMTSSTIPAIFAEFGEERFRVFEAAALAKVLDMPPAVIATGGGAPLPDANWRLMLTGNLCVHLDIDVDTAIARLGLGEGRPLVAEGAGPDARRDRLTSLLELRRPRYLQAPVQVEATRGAEDVTDEVVAAAWEAGLA